MLWQVTLIPSPRLALNLGVIVDAIKSNPNILSLNIQFLFRPYDECVFACTQFADCNDSLGDSCLLLKSISKPAMPTNWVLKLDRLGISEV